MTIGSAQGGRCPIDGCSHQASLYGGACKAHYGAAYKHTSDGVRTGATPKLSPEQVAAVRKRSSQFATQHQIAKEFGVTAKVISDVLKRRGAYAEAVAS